MSGGHKKCPEWGRGEVGTEGSSSQAIEGEVGRWGGVEERTLNAEH